MRNSALQKISSINIHHASRVENIFMEIDRLKLIPVSESAALVKVLSLIELNTLDLALLTSDSMIKNKIAELEQTLKETEIVINSKS